MPAPPAERRLRAERLRDYFALQLRLAESVAERTGKPVHELVGRWTNFYQRFGLGNVDLAATRPEWRAYCDELSRLRTNDARAAWTAAFYVDAPESAPRPERETFGCFGCDPPDDDGVMRIHFSNHDSADGVGPLSRAKIPRRRAELRTLFARVAAAHPRTVAVQGGSWLYNLEAYRRLFPPAYGESRRSLDKGRLSGTSSWGQFLDHNEAIKPDLRDAFLRKLPTIDLETPWRDFPLPALQTRAPIGLFHGFYDR